MTSTELVTYLAEFDKHKKLYCTCWGSPGLCFANHLHNFGFPFVELGEKERPVNQVSPVLWTSLWHFVQEI